MLKIVGFGDNVVDCYEDQRLMFPGGNALNVAVHATRFGAAGAYVGAVSDDAAGRHIRSALQAENVDISHLRIVPGQTAFCVVGTRNGEREFLRADLGVSIIEPGPGDLDLIATADAVHTGRSSHVDAHVPAFAERARLSFDFAVVRDRARIAAIAPHCYLASFSGGGMSEAEIDDLAGFVLGSGADWCLVTRGDEGAVLMGAGGRYSAEPAQAEVVDTLGAGDTFIARTLVGLLRNVSPDELLAQAAQAAAKTCGQIGGFGHPAPMEIDESHAKTLSEIYGATGEVGA